MIIDGFDGGGTREELSAPRQPTTIGFPGTAAYLSDQLGRYH